MKSAKEIKQLTDEVNRNHSSVEMLVINTHIEQAVRSGKYSIQIESLSSNAIKSLGDLGYTVKHFDDQRDNEFYYIISWS